jgi:hypothetical protein
MNSEFTGEAEKMITVQRKRFEKGKQLKFNMKLLQKYIPTAGFSAIR